METTKENMPLECPIMEITADYGYPPALAKACVDHFNYVMKLKTGEVIWFSDAKPISADWVMIESLVDPKYCDGMQNTWADGCPFDRGIEVRVSEIVYVADCPYGS